jgi:hypothetical protein
VLVDLVGPLPVSAGGLSYIFTMIDRFTRWLEALPLKETSALGKEEMKARASSAD